MRGAARKSQYYQKHGGRSGTGGRGATGRGGRSSRGRGRGGGAIIVTKVARGSGGGDGALASKWGHEAHTQQLKRAYKNLDNVGPHGVQEEGGGVAVPPGGFMSKSARARLMGRAAAGEVADAAIAAATTTTTSADAGAGAGAGAGKGGEDGDSLAAYMNQRDAAPKGREARAEPASEEAPRKRAKNMGGTMHADQFDSDDDRDW